LNWICEYCSSVNEGKDKVCFVCGAPRPSKAVIKRRRAEIEGVDREPSKVPGLISKLFRRLASLACFAGIILAAAAVVLCLIDPDSRQSLSERWNLIVWDVQTLLKTLQGESIQTGQLYSPLISTIVSRWNFRTGIIAVNWERFIVNQKRLIGLDVRIVNIANMMLVSVDEMIVYARGLINRVMGMFM